MQIESGCNFDCLICPGLFRLRQLAANLSLQYPRSYPGINENCEWRILSCLTGDYCAPNKFFAHKLPWIPGLNLAAGAIVGFTAIYATIIIRTNTSGKPPSAIVAAGLLLFIVGYVFNRNALSSPSNEKEVILEGAARQ